jgi:hypothetical protein
MENGVVKKSVYRTSDDLKNLAAPGDVEIGVALHLRAERFIGRVVFMRWQVCSPDLASR